ncbi:hypothetical protein [Streptomyces sp. NPDC012510]|uniref:hypothetical protein n=1 Tax=Streptomyces sp. NPDC012510 TaxID=3364838 RepID=UPI0036E9F1DD
MSGTAVGSPAGRAVTGSVAALALTGGALVTTSLLSPAGAAATWPTAKGSKAVSYASV